MTLYQFNVLDEMEQIEAFWDGVVIGEINDENGNTIECRQIDGFYVEYKKKDGIYLDMRSFKNPDLLQPYLDRMGEINI